MYDVDMVSSIPHALAGFNQWLCYKLVDRGGARKGKPPVSPKTGEICAKNDEKWFTTLSDALIGCETYDLDGVGFVFTNGFLAIDLDDCFKDDGTLTEVAQDIYDHFKDTYIEYSPSGNGLHIFVRGEKPNDRTKDSSIGVEVYDGYNFVTVTGDHIDGTGYDVMEMQDDIDWLFDTYLPDTGAIKKSTIVVNHGESTKEEWLELGLAKDKRLSELYNNVQHDGDESGTDMALLMKLAYWLNRDAEAVTEAFMASPWAASKDQYHQEKLNRKDYLSDSVDKAVCRAATTAYESDKQFKTRADSFLAFHTESDGSGKVELDGYTDYANAKAMSEIYKDILCYTKGFGWCYFNGAIWETDADWRAVTCAIAIGEALYQSGETWKDSLLEVCKSAGVDSKSQAGRKITAEADELLKHAKYTLSNRGITAMINLGKSLMIDDASSFDNNPWILNTPDFAIDLTTGERLAHSARHKCTNCTTLSPSFEPNKEVKVSPMFDKFLHQIFCDDEELIEYFQLQMGAALVGKVYDENLLIANGSGSNGKSTVFGVLQHILGDYATSVDPELLMTSHVNEQQVGMAMMQGKRLAIAQETESGQELRTSMLKRLASTDTVVAKRLYKDPMEFTPTHTLVLSTNHLPRINACDPGTWRRIVVIPFNATIKAEDMITDFKEVLLRNEGVQILDWAIDGAVKFYARNCVLSEKPQAVLDASNEYREAEDWLKTFVGDCLIEEPEGVAFHKELYNVYVNWARMTNERAMTSNAFSRALSAAGWKSEPKRYNYATQKTGKAWLGVSIKGDQLEDAKRMFRRVV